MKAGDVVWVEGYDSLDDPQAVVVGTSWATTGISREEAESALKAEGYMPDGEPISDIWRSVLADDRYDVDGEWHSNGSGKRVVHVLVFSTTRRDPTGSPS